MAPRRSSRANPDHKPSEQTLGKTKVEKPAIKKTTSKRSTSKKATSTVTSNKETAANKRAAATEKAPSAPTTKTTRTTTTTTLTTIKPTESFPCACIKASAFKARLKDRRLVLGRPEYNDDTSVLCTCKVHFKCANSWALAHDELPPLLPCGHPITKRGAEFWASAMPGRRAEIKDKEEKEQSEKEKNRQEVEAKEKEEMEKKTLVEDDFDWGSDLTDLED